MNHNERTGAFGTPQFYNYGNTPQLFTHFDGITAVPGGFNLATITTCEPALRGTAHRRAGPPFLQPPCTARRTIVAAAR
jgi:hypothetical protein